MEAKTHGKPIEPWIKYKRGITLFIDLKLLICTIFNGPSTRGMKGNGGSCAGKYSEESQLGPPKPHP